MLDPMLPARLTQSFDSSFNCQFPDLKMNTILFLNGTWVGDWIIKILGAAGGLIGTGLGLYNFFHTRSKERGERKRDEADWQVYLSLRTEMKLANGDVFVPDEDSDEHKWAERMVAKGLLVRGVGGIGYILTSRTL